MINEERKFDLEDRLVKFSVMIISLVESLPDDRAAVYLANQLIKSGLSPALNYGEAKSAESINDFIHKMKISLKELRESYVALKIIKAKPFLSKEDLLNQCICECNELIAIFVKSIQTADKNRKNK
jgi:four helix bundle protein